uniref:ENT domain-containing protein n=1 Tax=Brassica campestris TaxID=3711 RepID=M4E3N5_BRACM
MSTTSKSQEELDSIFKQKRVVRSTVRKSLKAMNPSLRTQQDDAIQNTVLEAPWFKSCRRLCAYISCKSLNEVDTSRILSKILQHPDSNTMGAKKLYVPWVEDKKSNMRMLHISHMDDLIANSMNILEPALVDALGNEREDVLQADEPIDLFILPGLAFDRCGRRLGRGGGYYDTFLKRYEDRAKAKGWSNPLMVALSYSPQILEDGGIPVTPNDVMIDALVTPSGVVPITPPAIERVHNDMETQIHLIEQEAYSSILRAFKAQSDAITWEKESLITELRKELRVSDEEHRELLSRVNADEMIRRIREWRKGNSFQSGAPQMVHDNAPSPAVSGSRKKQKTSQPIASLAMGAPSPAMHPSMQPSSSAALRRGGPPPGPKTKKPKTFPATGIAGRPQPGAVANEPDPLVGKKVWTKWPEDNNFYEAVITDYKAAEGRHALVYDMNTLNETWEWVNLKEISPGDIRWEGEDAGVSRKGGHPGQGRGSTKAMARGGPAGQAIGRGRGSMKIQQHKAQNGVGKKALGDIEILHTDTLIKEVEKVFRSVNPSPAEVEKAKKVLRDHEQALVDAIARLEEMSDGESGNI